MEPTTATRPTAARFYADLVELDACAEGREWARANRIRLGFVSAGYERRLERCSHEQAWRRLARDASGRFLGVMPWHRWPQPVLYRWDGQR